MEGQMIQYMQEKWYVKYRHMRIQDCAKLLDQGYLPTEKGFCVMPDGSGFAATKVFMPGVTPEMIGGLIGTH